MNTHNDFNGATVVLINHPGKMLVCSFIENLFYSKYMVCMNTTGIYNPISLVLRWSGGGVAGVSTSHLPPILRANLSPIIRTQTSFKKQTEHHLIHVLVPPITIVGNL